VAARVRGNDPAVTLGNPSGLMELNGMMPLPADVSRLPALRLHCRMVLPEPGDLPRKAPTPERRVMQ
jgi:hypothetical protein